ncbi:hypothetical protein AVEN_164435-1 [Araneus ventricosus]|uniref:Uncharacterized protein n=1 Tax=Araneus ventricosus TaxID=182803 RepID=A0A4Y2NEC1_ARAVE|nr:hypothetical protein AVEN_164435-1 [Araneus ventricosus]
MLVLWLGREFYRGKHGVTASDHSETPDLGDKFGDLGDKSMIPENATLFLISQLGKKMRSNVRENSNKDRYAPYLTSRDTKGPTQHNAKFSVGFENAENYYIMVIPRYTEKVTKDAQRKFPVYPPLYHSSTSSEI